MNALYQCWADLGDGDRGDTAGHAQGSDSAEGEGRAAALGRGSGRREAQSAAKPAAEDVVVVRINGSFTDSKVRTEGPQ